MTADLDPVIRAAAEAMFREYLGASLGPIPMDSLIQQEPMAWATMVKRATTAVEAAAPLIGAAPTLVDFDGRHFRHGYVLALIERAESAERERDEAIKERDARRERKIALENAEKREERLAADLGRCRAVLNETSNDRSQQIRRAESAERERDEYRKQVVQLIATAEKDADEAEAAEKREADLRAYMLALADDFALPANRTADNLDEAYEFVDTMIERLREKAGEK